MKMPPPPRSLAVLTLAGALLVALAACGTSRSQSLREDVEEALAEAGDSPSARLNAAATTLWESPSYDHEVEVASDGTRLEVVSSRVDVTVFARDLNGFAVAELRVQTIRIFRLLRSLSPDHPLETVRFTVRIPARSEEYEGHRPVDFLVVRASVAELRAVEGFASVDPWDVHRGDRFGEQGEALIRNMLDTMHLEHDGRSGIQVR